MVVLIRVSRKQKNLSTLMETQHIKAYVELNINIYFVSVQGRCKTTSSLAAITALSGTFGDNAKIPAPSGDIYIWRAISWDCMPGTQCKN
jgi:hypothetical protein